MNRLLTLGARRPPAALAAWVVATAILGSVGSGGSTVVPLGREAGGSAGYRPR